MVLGVKKSDVRRTIDHFGFVVPAVENRKILAGSFSSVKFDGRCDEENLIIRVFIGGATQSDLLKSERKLAAHTANWLNGHVILIGVL